MPEPTRPRSVLDDGSAARQRPIVKAVVELTEQFRRVADTLAPLAASLTPADAPSDASPTDADDVGRMAFVQSAADAFADKLTEVEAERDGLRQRLQDLHEGEEPYIHEGTVASPAQWIWQWNRITPARRLEIAEMAMRDYADARRCSIEGHRRRLAALNAPLTPADEPGPACAHLLWDRNGFGVIYCTSCLAALDERGRADA